MKILIAGTALGMRREAQRHAAFVLARNSQFNRNFPAPESGVAASLCHRSPKSWPAVAGLSSFYRGGWRDE